MYILGVSPNARATITGKQAGQLPWEACLLFGACLPSVVM